MKSDALNRVEFGLRQLYGCSVDVGQFHITEDGLAKSIIGKSKPPFRKIIGGRAYCSCCNNPFSEILEWNLLQICDGCWTLTVSHHEEIQ